MFQPNLFQPKRSLLFCAAIVVGGLLAIGFIWLFGIEFSAFERFSQFPDDWTMLEFIMNAAGGIIFVGMIRAVYMGLLSYYFGDPSDDPPAPGAGW